MKQLGRATHTVEGEICHTHKQLQYHATPSHTNDIQFHALPKSSYNTIPHQDQTMHAEQTISKPRSFISQHTHNTIHHITLSESEQYRTIPHNTNATQDHIESKIIHNTTLMVFLLLALVRNNWKLL